MNRTVSLLVAIVWSTTSCVAAEEIRFSTQIRPILSDKCFQCHGPDAAKRAAGLRLDEEPAAKSVLESGATAIVPGDLSASVLLNRITSTDPDLHMPPAESGKTLSDRVTQIVDRIRCDVGRALGVRACTASGATSFGR